MKYQAGKFTSSSLNSHINQAERTCMSFTPTQYEVRDETRMSTFDPTRTLRVGSSGRRLRGFQDCVDARLPVAVCHKHRIGPWTVTRRYPASPGWSKRRVISGSSIRASHTTSSYAELRPKPISEMVGPFEFWSNSDLHMRARSGGIHSKRVNSLTKLSLGF